METKPVCWKKNDLDSFFKTMYDHTLPYISKMTLGRMNQAKYYKESNFEPLNEHKPKPETEKEGEEFKL